MSTAEKESVDSIAIGLKQSLESAVRGLNAFLESLTRSGMPDATDGYRRLQAVLMQQRLWARNNARDELEPLFESIAAAAANIEAVISPYASIMGQLKDLDKIEQVEFNEPNSEKTEKTALKADSTKFVLSDYRETANLIGLILIRGPISMKALAKASRIKTELLRKRIKNLIESGAVSRRGKGGGVSYQLSVEFITSVMREIEEREQME